MIKLRTARVGEEKLLGWMRLGAGLYSGWSKVSLACLVNVHRRYIYPNNVSAFMTLWRSHCDVSWSVPQPC
jgi:hypothetical protein